MRECLTRLTLRGDANGSAVLITFILRAYMMVDDVELAKSFLVKTTFPETAGTDHWAK